MTALLNSLGVLRATGPDAEKYLQGQLTADVRELSETQARPAALCDTKGRVQANLVILVHAADYYCLVPHSMIEHTLKRLKKFALFSKVTLSDDTANWHIAALQRDQAAINAPFTLSSLSQGLQLSLPGRCQRMLVISRDHQALLDYLHQQQQQGYQTEDDASWALNNIEARWAQVTPPTQELFTPQMLAIEQLGGVSFAKGCYVGQEIVARTQHLGKLKRHLHQVTLQLNAQNVSPVAGTPILNDTGETVGHLVNVHDNAALAVLEDRASSTARLFANNTPLTLSSI